MVWFLKEDAIVPVEFNEVLSAITGNFKGVVVPLIHPLLSLVSDRFV